NQVMLGVFIPSMGRHHLVSTVKWLPSMVKTYTHLVVPKNELENYLHAGIGVQVLACQEKGIGPTRDWIMGYAKSRKYKWAVMMDDDLGFHVRRKDDPTLFKQATEQDMVQLFNQLRVIARTYAHFSVLPKQGSNRVQGHI